jgi:hypothetical protein
MMPNYRRWYVPGGTYFFTAVTFDRLAFLTSDLARSLLREAIDEVREERVCGIVHDDVDVKRQFGSDVFGNTRWKMRTIFSAALIMCTGIR